MKCLKNPKTNEIIRVDDIKAHQMAGNQWQYVSKSEWKSKPRTNEDIMAENIAKTVNEIIVEKLVEYAKNKKQNKKQFKK